MAREDLERYKLLWLSLETLWQEGDQDGPLADLARDLSDGPWRRMTAEEKASFTEWVRQRDPA